MNRCQKLNNKGKRCNRQANKKYCWQHSKSRNNLLRQKGGALGLELLFDTVQQKSKELRENDIKADGLAFWQAIKPTLLKYPNIKATQEFKKMDSKMTSIILDLPEKIINGHEIETMIQVNHFIIQCVRIPIKDQPNLQKILQIALNIGQYLGHVSKSDHGVDPEIDRYIRSLKLSDYINDEDISKINEKLSEDIISRILSIPVLK
jgi:hypothetical protein